MERIEGRNHGMTCQQIRAELCDLIRTRRGLIVAYRRKRSWRESERAMAITGAQAQIRALESVLPPPLNVPYNGQSEAPAAKPAPAADPPSCLEGGECRAPLFTNSMRARGRCETCGRTLKAT